MPIIQDAYTVLNAKEFSNLKSGDKVKIVPYWNDKSMQNSDGYMDKYLDCIVTIDRTVGSSWGASWVKIIEDDNYWDWNRFCFCEIIQRKEYKPASEESLALLFS